VVTITLLIFWFPDWPEKTQMDDSPSVNNCHLCSSCTKIAEHRRGGGIAASKQEVYVPDDTLEVYTGRNFRISPNPARGAFGPSPKFIFNILPPKPDFLLFRSIYNVPDYRIVNTFFFWFANARNPWMNYLTMLQKHLTLFWRLRNGTEISDAKFVWC
jgi:hypothetical protein